MSDPIGDAARDPVGGPAAGAEATIRTPEAGAESPAGPLGAEAGSGTFDGSTATIVNGVIEAPPGSVVCPLLELVRGIGSSEPSPDADQGETSRDQEMSSTDSVWPLPKAAGVGADRANRCAASSPPALVSVGQQRFVCLDASHVDCPRFVRATASPRAGGGRTGRPAVIPVEAAVVSAVVAGEARPTGTSVSGGTTSLPTGSASAVAGGAAATAAMTHGRDGPSGSGASRGVGTAAATTPGPSAVDQPASPVVPVVPVTRSSRRSGARRAGSRPTPTIIAGGILGVALILTVAFVSMRGGLALPVSSPSSGPVASPSLTAIASASPTAPPSPSPTTVPSPTMAPSPSTAPSPVSSPTPESSPSASLPAAYQGRAACPDRPNCYLYRVHSGDSMTGIAARFGITLAALKQANPEITDPSLLHVGDRIRVPLPPA